MATIVVSKEVIDIITIVLSKEDCYLSLPDFYEVLADKVSKHNGGSRPTIDCRKIRITKSVYDELKRCLKETYTREDDREMFSDKYISDGKQESCYDCKYVEQCYLTEKRMKKYPNGAC